MKHAAIMTREQARRAVQLANASRYPGRENFAAWNNWVRESWDRLDEFDRRHHEESCARLKEISL